MPDGAVVITCAVWVGETARQVYRPQHRPGQLKLAAVQRRAV